MASVRQLESYLCDRWVRGDGSESLVLIDPTTEEAVAESSVGGLDWEGALEYARRVGGPALRAMTFAQRGDLLARAAALIHDHREDLVALSITNGGNTRSDAKMDIDGASATLASYGRLGKTLGDRRWLADGEPQKIAASPRYAGGHLWVSRQGAAIHINAYNFPAWGLAEKAAVAWLAGLPVVTKPAPETALVAEAVVRAWVEADLLPPGALTFFAGGEGPALLDGLQSQDCVAFTGSADTAALVRGRTEFHRTGARLNVEADSLNSALLGPDVEPGSETWELFLRDVQREMTQKAGQKCTATRRIFVPEDRVDEVMAAFIEELGEVPVGHPGRRSVRMGPLVHGRQLEAVKAALEVLTEEAEVLTGGDRPAHLIDVAPGKGFFLAPTLLLVPEPQQAPGFHSVEAFGPVAGIAPWDGSPAAAVELINRGGGSLVASIYSDDLDFAREVAFGIAPFHGRINLGSARVADHAMGPGVVLPKLVHGGPGRAGGGEELGGRRGLAFYMQRLAVQGFRPWLESLL